MDSKHIEKIAILEKQLEKAIQKQESLKQEIENYKLGYITKDKAILTLQQQMKKYEQKYGIEDAMKEIQYLKEQLYIRNKQNTDLQAQINKQLRTITILQSKLEVFESQHISNNCRNCTRSLILKRLMYRLMMKLLKRLSH